MGIHLSSSFSADAPSHVRANPERDDDFAVQVFLGGDSFHTLYFSIESARELAQQILDALPAKVPA